MEAGTVARCDVLKGTAIIQTMEGKDFACLGVLHNN